MKTISRAVLAFIALGAVTSASAIPLSFDFTGNVLGATSVPNAFGLSSGDTISGSAFIADADLVGAQSYTPFTGLELSFVIGDVSFVDWQDYSYPFGPSLDILDGDFVSLVFLADDFVQFAFTAFAPGVAAPGEWAATQYDPAFQPIAELYGSFDVAAPTPVPEPGMLTLLAAGLLAVGLTRRRRPMLSRAAT